MPPGGIATSRRACHATTRRARFGTDRRRPSKHHVRSIHTRLLHLTTILVLKEMVSQHEGRDQLVTRCRPRACCWRRWDDHRPAGSPRPSHTYVSCTVRLQSDRRKCQNHRPKIIASARRQRARCTEAICSDPRSRTNKIESLRLHLSTSFYAPATTARTAASHNIPSKFGGQSSSSSSVRCDQASGRCTGTPMRRRRCPSSGTTKHVTATSSYGTSAIFSRRLNSTAATTRRRLERPTTNARKDGRAKGTKAAFTRPTGTVNTWSWLHAEEARMEPPTSAMEAGCGASCNMGTRRRPHLILSVRCR